MDIDNYNIVLTDNAKTDLEEIYKYISEKILEPNSASKLMKKIEKEILLLERNPYSCIEITVKPHNEVIYGKRDYLA